MRALSPTPSLAGLLLLVVFVAPASANRDLILDGTTTSLSGVHTFDNVTIVNGSTLFVDAFDGTDGGELAIKATSVLVDATSSIIADGRGFRGVLNARGEGPGGGDGGDIVFDGGGGGGYGGQGGNGGCDFLCMTPDGVGGPAYGNAVSVAIQKGSAGGSAGTADGDFGGTGGNGGGAVSLEADIITIAGTISADGGDGMIYVNDSSGGGAGGGILLRGETVTVGASALLSANGGGGGIVCGQSPCALDDGGGGGGGGRIKVFYFKQLNSQGVTSANGGSGSGTAANGQDGTVHTERLDTTPDCTLDLGASHTDGTLILDFTLGADQPTTWSVFMFLSGGVIPLWCLELPKVDPPVTFPVPIPAFPEVGLVAFVTMLATPQEIACIDFAVVDTGTPP